MSLNFFNSKTQKTDATLSFQAVLESLDGRDDSSDCLKIDEFVQQENIHLRQHQDLYHIVHSEETTAPKSISKEDKLNAKDTRIAVNSLIDLSHLMPDIKATAEQCNEKLKSTLEQSNDTIKEINSIKL